MIILFDYILIIPSILGCLGIGRLLIKTSFFSSFIAGLFTIASIVGPLVYCQVKLIKPYLFIVLILGIIIFIYELIKNFDKEKLNQKNLINILYLFFLFIFFLLYFRGLNYSNHIYESHDLSYFAWISEVFVADYNGPAKWPIAWPHYIAATHLIPGSIIAVLSSFLIHKNLATSIEIRYLLIVFTFIFLIYENTDNKSINKFLVLFKFLIIFSIFREEFIYNITISSFAYLIILLEILKIIFNKKNKIADILYYSFLLTICKAPIALMGLSMIIWFGFKNLQNIFQLRNFAGIFIVGINFFFWITAPKPTRDIGAWDFAHPLDYISIAQFIQLPNWVPKDNISTLFGNFFVEELYYQHVPYILFLFFIYIIFKYYLLYFYFLNKIIINFVRKNLQNKSFLIKLKGLDIFIMVSLFSIVFLRNGPGAGLTHQAHGFLLLSTVTLYIIMYYSIKIKDIKIIITLFIVSIVFNFNQNIFNPIVLLNKEIIKSPTSYIYDKSELNSIKYDKNNFYLSNNQNISKSQMLSSLAGIRYALKDNKMPENSDFKIMIIRKK